MEHVYNVKLETKISTFNSYLNIAELDITLPALIDLESELPPAFNQGREGSCTAFGWGGMWAFFELKAIKAHQRNPEVFSPGQYVNPSFQFFYYNERVHEGDVDQDGGAQISTGAFVLANTGCCDETHWPYLQSNFEIQPSKQAYQQANQHKVPYAYALDGEADILHCLASGYPVVCGIACYEELQSQEVAESGILPDPGPNSQFLGGHCVLIVGYDLRKKMFKIRNSWSPQWGQNGYFWVTFNFIENYASVFMSLRQQSQLGGDLMNQELHALLNIAFDAEKLTVDGVHKNYAGLFGDAISLIGDMPGAISDWSDLLNELKGLNQAANEADLLSYIEQKLSTIPAFSGAKPQAVMTAMIGLINAAYAVEQAFVS